MMLYIKKYLFFYILSPLVFKLLTILWLHLHQSCSLDQSIYMKNYFVKCRKSKLLCYFLVPFVYIIHCGSPLLTVGPIHLWSLRAHGCSQYEVEWARTRRISPFCTSQTSSRPLWTAVNSRAATGWPAGIESPLSAIIICLHFKYELQMNETPGWNPPRWEFAV